MAYNGLFICYFLHVAKKLFGRNNSKRTYIFLAFISLSRFDQGIVCYILEVSDSLTYTCYFMCAFM